MASVIKLPNCHEIHQEPLLIEIPDDVFSVVTSKVDKLSRNLNVRAKLNNFSASLAGAIEKQVYTKPIVEIERFIENLLNEDTSLLKEISRPVKIVNHVAWINFMKKYEYNPSHNHTGNLSYVLWVKIPYSLKEEDQYENCKNSRDKFNGRFVFEFVNKLLQISVLPIDVDQNYEKKIVLFDSRLRHSVHPFYTSDDFRISLAGNFTLI